MRCAPDMIDVQVVDAWFEAGKDMPCGPVRFAVFDRSTPLTLDQLAFAGGSETGEACTVETLQRKAAEGCFPLPEPGRARPTSWAARSTSRRAWGSTSVWSVKGGRTRS
jgi:hypothetical protein